MRYVKNNWRILSIRVIAFTYLIGVYCYMALYFSYYVRIADKPLGYFIVSMRTLGIYLLYVVVNHLIVGFVVRHRILLIYDILAFIMLWCIAKSDIWIENGLNNIEILGPY